MSTISTLLTNIYDNIINFNNINIIVLFDKSNNLWFSYNNLLNSIGYNNVKMQKWRLQLDNKYFDTYENIFKTSKLNKDYETNIQPHTKMINESGLYLLLSKSNKILAKKLMEKMFVDVLPSLRKNGKYILNSKEKSNIKALTKKLQLKSKEQSIRNTTKKQYNNLSGKGFIYILKVNTIQDGKEKQCYKIGYTTNLNKRIATYKTGNPDIELAHQENVNCNKKQLEKCVLNLNILKRIGSKKEVICDSPLEEIKKEIEDCKKLIARYSSNTG